MAGFEKIQRQLFFTNEMLIERGICEAALFGNVADAGRSQAAFAEELHRCAEDLTLGPRIILANVERKGICHLARLAVANQIARLIVPLPS